MVAMKNTIIFTAFVAVSLLSFIIITSAAPTIDEYMQLRAEALETEDSMMLGGSSTLDSRETLVNNILMFYKDREYAEGLANNGDWFAATKHIFHAMDLIEGSNVFKLIRLMPKGAALHMHDSTVARSSIFVKNISTWDNLYYCIGDNSHLLFHFYPAPPSSGCTETSDWKTVTSLREQASSPEWVDQFFFKSMNMMTQTPDADYPNTNVAWDNFEKKITTVSGMGNFEPAFREYYYDTLKFHHEDNIMYIEMRGLLSSVYHLNQTELTNVQILRALKEETDRFLANYPDFFGAKYIYAPHRFHPPTDIGDMIDDAVQMKVEFPEYFAGFDLVGQEDKGPPLLTFLPQLLNATDKGVKFFFHAGETDWRGTKIDQNLVDAVLLNTTRFGHGYALYSHPYLYEKAKQQKIAVEVCPISNQILGLVKDFRNHPGFNYMRDDFPVIIAADGPGIFGTTALSHDYYIAFMALGGERADLRFLKKLAMNSIEYSAMGEGEKVMARAVWEAKWSIFLDEAISKFSNIQDDIVDNSINPYI